MGALSDELSEAIYHNRIHGMRSGNDVIGLHCSSVAGVISFPENNCDVFINLFNSANSI